jgi:hypothetical protein
VFKDVSHFARKRHRWHHVAGWAILPLQDHSPHMALGLTKQTNFFDVRVTVHRVTVHRR